MKHFIKSFTNILTNSTLFTINQPNMLKNNIMINAEYRTKNNDKITWHNVTFMFDYEQMTVKSIVGDQDYMISIDGKSASEVFVDFFTSGKLFNYIEETCNIDVNFKHSHPNVKLLMNYDLKELFIYRGHVENLVYGFVVQSLVTERYSIFNSTDNLHEIIYIK